MALKKTIYLIKQKHCLFGVAWLRVWLRSAKTWKQNKCNNEAPCSRPLAWYIIARSHLCVRVDTRSRKMQLYHDRLLHCCKQHWRSHQYFRCNPLPSSRWHKRSYKHHGCCGTFRHSGKHLASTDIHRHLQCSIGLRGKMMKIALLPFRECRCSFDFSLWISQFYRGLLWGYLWLMVYKKKKGGGISNGACHYNYLFKEGGKCLVIFTSCNEFPTLKNSNVKVKCCY